MSKPPSWVDVRSLPANSRPDLLNLDAGERDAIALAEEIAADLLVLDDSKGRRASQDRGLTVIGTLGILRDAASVGLLDLDDALKDLSETSFHLSPAIIEALRSKR